MNARKSNNPARVSLNCDNDDHNLSGDEHSM